MQLSDPLDDRHADCYSIAHLAIANLWQCLTAGWFTTVLNHWSFIAANELSSIAFKQMAWNFTQEKVRVNTGLDGHRPRPCLHRLPTCLCLWWNHFKCGPTMDTNGLADGCVCGHGQCPSGPCCMHLFLCQPLKYETCEPDSYAQYIHTNGIHTSVATVDGQLGDVCIQRRIHSYIWHQKQLL